MAAPMVDYLHLVPVGARSAVQLPGHWLWQVAQAPGRALAWLGGRRLGETADPSNCAPVSVACGVLVLPGLAASAAVALAALHHQGLPMPQAAALAACGTLLGWWLDRQLLRTAEVATWLPGMLAGAARGLLPLAAGLLVWMQLPQWHASGVQQHQQQLRAATADAAALLAQRQAALASLQTRARQQGQARQATLAEQAKAQLQFAIGLRAVARCEREAGRLKQSIPDDDESLLHDARLAQWQAKTEACTERRALAQASRDAAELPLATSLKALDATDADTRQALARAEQALAQVRDEHQSLQTQRLACRIGSARCAFDQAVSAGVVPVWQVWVLPLALALWVAWPWALRSLHPLEPAARARRQSAQMEQMLAERKAAMVQGMCE